MPTIGTDTSKSPGKVFTPRLTAPGTNDPNWINTAYGGRNMCIVGSNGGISVLPNCFSGDTQIITDKGLITLCEHVGELHKILTIDDTYNWAVIGFFGLQELYEVELSNGHNYRCTRNHRWVVYDSENLNHNEVVYTQDLRIGMIIRCTYYGDCKLTHVASVRCLNYSTSVYCPIEPKTHTCVLSGGEVTGQCTGYAWGRFMEILGSQPTLSRGDAGTWFYYNDGYSRGSVPALGAVVCWDQPGNAGHVAIVEQIHDDGTITMSMSGWASPYFWTETHGPPRYYGNSTYNLQGFIYNPAAGTVPGGALSGGVLIGGNLYDMENDEDDAVLREVGYWKDNTVVSTSSDIRCSVINYTTVLNTVFKGAISNGLGGSGIDVNGMNDISRAIVEYMIARGLPPSAGVGIAGNVYAECSNNIGQAVIDSNGAYSYGMCMWNGSNGTAMLAYVGSNWKTDLTGQLNFLWYDMTERNASWLCSMLEWKCGINSSSFVQTLASLPNNLDGAKRAADIFVRCYENPYDPDGQSIHRQDIASQIWSTLIPQLTSNRTNRM